MQTHSTIVDYGHYGNMWKYSRQWIVIQRT